VTVRGFHQRRTRRPRHPCPSTTNRHSGSWRSSRSACRTLSKVGRCWCRCTRNKSRSRTGPVADSRSGCDTGGDRSSGYRVPLPWRGLTLAPRSANRVGVEVCVPLQGSHRPPRGDIAHRDDDDVCGRRARLSFRRRFVRILVQLCAGVAGRLEHAVDRPHRGVAAIRNWIVSFDCVAGVPLAWKSLKKPRAIQAPASRTRAGPVLGALMHASEPLEHCIGPVFRDPLIRPDKPEKTGSSMQRWAVTAQKTRTRATPALT